MGPPRSSMLFVIFTILASSIVFGGIGYYVGIAQSMAQLAFQDSAVPGIGRRGAPFPTPSPSASDQTAGWKTYTNTPYAFSFNYPQDWILNKSAATNYSDPVADLTSPETKKNNTSCSAPCEGAGPDISFYYYSSVADITVNKLNKDGAKTLDEFIQKEGIQKNGTIQLGDVIATQVTESGLGGYYVVYAEKNNHVYEIFFHHRATQAELSPTENQILSSFKFTK